MDIEALRSQQFAPYVHSYSERDVVLYHLGLGATALQDLYERHPAFAPFPTFSIVAAHPVLQHMHMDKLLPGFKHERALHGEQFLRVVGQLPPHGQLVTQARLVDVRDKGKNAVLVIRSVTRDALLGHLVAENEFVAVCLGAGGFGSPWPEAPRPAAATAANTPPPRAPDHTAVVPTAEIQAALYRLSGDVNPLHIDPEVARQAGGFERPILHGLCTLGMSVKAVTDWANGSEAARGGSQGLTVSSVMARFTRHVFPGDTLRVHMWRDLSSPMAASPDEAGLRVVFETVCMRAGRGETVGVVAGAAVELCARQAGGTGVSRL